MNNTGYRQANAYYGGRYNPVNIYGGGRQGSEVISMYNPEAEAQFLQASMRAQERFDKASMASAQALSTIGGMETYDAPELQTRLKTTQDKINKLVQDKYSGDYGAASNEIVNIIGAERAHPFYRFNAQKLAAAKTFQEDRRRLGANFMAADDPMAVGFKDWQEGADFAYTAVNRQDIVNNSAAMFKSMANKLMSDPAFRSTEGGKFLERTLQYGFKGPEEAREFLSTDLGKNMISDLRESMPALAELDQNAVADAILQGSYAGIGQSRFETRADPAYMDEYERARLAAMTAPTDGGDIIPPMDLVKLQEGLKDTSIQADIKSKLFEKEFAEGIQGIKSYDELTKAKNIAAAKSTTGMEEVVDPRMVAAGLGPAGTVRPRAKITTKDMEIMDAHRRVEQEFSKLYSDPESYDYALQTFNLTPLAAYTGKGQKEVKTLVTTLNDEIGKRLPTEKVQGVGSESKKLLESYNIDADITNITVIDTAEGPKYILNLTAANKDKERKELQVEITGRSLNKLITRNLLGISREAGKTSFSDFYNYYWPAK